MNLEKYILEGWGERASIVPYKEKEAETMLKKSVRLLVDQCNYEIINTLHDPKDKDVVNHHYVSMRKLTNDKIYLQTIGWRKYKDDNNNVRLTIMTLEEDRKCKIPTKEDRIREFYARRTPHGWYWGD